MATHTLNHSKHPFLFLFAFTVCSFVSSTLYANSLQDPARAGDPLPGLTAAELSYFQEGKARFLEVDGVANSQRAKNPRNGGGLGPRFNLNSCGGCHVFPAIGGSSPAVNPQIAVATLSGARNTIPSFITANGPIREARFKQNADGTPDGGVHDLFVITGRTDAGSCNIQQPNFSQALSQNNIIYRIPTPIFGGGLIEAISDATILANKANNADAKRAWGIAGHENRNPNDGTITRFGWKAQNKSLLLFAGEAYNVEQGVTNELFPTKRDETAGCTLNALPEDVTNFGLTDPLQAMSDIAGHNDFMRFLAPPTPKSLTPTAQHGSDVFVSIGCAMCHTPTLRTSTSTTAALSNKNANLYSDLLVHHMGSGLADNVTQGLAAGDEFRTAPLWGISQRLFYLHDGRTNDLQLAIRAHASAHPNPDPHYPDSEANRVIANFNALSPADRSSLFEFLQSL